jgi:hypothetical protein
VYLHGSENLAEVCDATAAEKRPRSRLHHFLSAAGSVIIDPITALQQKNTWRRRAARETRWWEARRNDHII